MLAFLELIENKLNAILPSFLEEPPQGTPYPYATFEFNPSQEDFQREILILEINVWDKNTDTTALETYADNIDKALHRFKYYKKDVLQTCIYRLNRSMIADPEPLIKRRHLLFQCKTYFQRSE